MVSALLALIVAITTIIAFLSGEPPTSSKWLAVWASLAVSALWLGFVTLRGDRDL